MSVEAPARVLPNLITIGAQKCGTSALHYYLSFHPEIEMSRPKELNFFIKQRNWPEGEEWYERHFEPSAKVRGESSPNYTAFPHFKGVAKRMHGFVPDAKLIYLVRDPIDRIVSQYVHNYTKRRSNKDLRTTVMNEGSTYIPRSSYHSQVKQFLKFYPEERLLVLAQDDLRDDRMGTLKRVFRFLEVDETFESPKYSRMRHQTGKKERRTRIGMYGPRLPAPIWRRLEPRVKLTEEVERPLVDERLRSELTARLKDDIDAFREYTGRDFADWSI